MIFRANVPDFDTDRDPGDEQEENKFKYTQDELDEIKRMHEAWEFDKWWNEGFVLANKRNRIEAFAAIRRAVEPARKYDAQERQYRNNPNCAASNALCISHAAAIRRAIRAAIGWNKA